MPTFLFDKIIFGPVKSRRLGVSLGINLLPVDAKVCSFDCIYCECGRNSDSKKGKVNLPKRFEVQQKLQIALTRMVSESNLPDVITFAGNGEPTLHPEFALIIDDTIELRDRLTPNARIAVLSNATMLAKKDVFKALLKVDDNIQKLDSAIEETIALIDCPNKSFSLNKTIEQLVSFNGKVIIQTLFVKGKVNEIIVDNTTETEVDKWIELLKKINPSKVMIYTIDRDTPTDTLEKISKTELNLIAGKVTWAGFETQVSA